MKLKKKELDNLKALVDKISTKQNEIGLNTINGHKLAHEFSQLEIQLNNMKSSLQEIYGKCNINIETGELEKIESNETNKED
jgi:hypothetical protein|tara:strand:+ start:164 stop:409 length:246 start_codon:yes stop_codon:yes gene_type:complete